ncbi:MAG: hypothetical protein SFW62_08475 [Alphaproteobacteria bacterium]|nr:hypothetical protein [Alphaproteobacteria bacterium]
MKRKKYRPPAPANDAEINGLVQRLNLTLNGPRGSIVTFIAARSGEGTSTVAQDAAMALAAETGRKILLLDAGPLDAERFWSYGLDPYKGIVEMIAAGQPITEAINPIERSVQFARWMGREENRGLTGKLAHDDAFWNSLREAFGITVIDAPARNYAPDGLALAARADATVLVVEAEATRQPVVENLRDTLTAARAKIAGVVLNKRRFYIPRKVYARL